MSSPEASPRGSKTPSPISATEAVNVRDSWDVLDTPRTAQSDSDYIETQAKIREETSEPRDGTSLKIEIHSQEELRQQADVKLSKKSRKPKTTMRKLDSQEPARWAEECSPKRPSSATRQNSHRDRPLSAKHTHRPLSAKNTYNSTHHDNSLGQHRPVSAGILRPSTPEVTKRTVIPRRYRKLGLRSTEQMLQDEYAALRHLLKDCENVSRSELREQHIEQTRNMIADYKAMNRGAKTRGIIIARSLPESLRPKSPRSTTSSCYNSPRGGSTSRSYSSSRSCSPDSRRGSKRVSFGRTRSLSSDRSRSPSPESTPVSRERSESPGDRRRESNSPRRTRSGSGMTGERTRSDSERTSERTRSDSDRRSSTDSRSQSGSSRNSPERRNASPGRCSDAEPAGSLDNELKKRNKTKTPKKAFQYTSTESERLSRPKKQQLKKSGTKKTAKSKEKSVEDSFLSQLVPRPAYGVYEDINGNKHSDSNLKRTANSDIKKWLREKEKMIKASKKKQKEKEEREKAAKEKELKERDEKKALNDTLVKKWQTRKKKEARLLRRQNVAKRKLLESVNSIRPTDLSARKQTTEPIKGTRENPIKPSAPLHPRPKSAPAKRRVVKPQQVPLDVLIKNNPDLKKKLTTLEKQKQMKHRQSYDDWIKVKDTEKKSALKTIREQRQKLEKEISEESARVISEAAKRRIDNLRYKGSTETRESREPPKEKPVTPPPPEPRPYTWQQHGTGQSTGARTLPTDKRSTGPTASCPSTVPPQPRRPTSAKPKPTNISANVNPNSTTNNQTRPGSAKRNVEDKIAQDQTNPYSKPYSPTKKGTGKSRLQEGGINGPEFSRFIWDLVNEQENGGRPEPQGADSPIKNNEEHNSKPGAERENLKPHPPHPTQSKSPTPPAKPDLPPEGEPVIQHGKTIFSMTSIEG